MRYFPLTVVEDFFVEPHLVLEFAKTAEYEPRGETNYPGVVTDHLNQEITNWVATKALSSFYDFKTTSLSWIGNSTFQKITPYGDENQFHILNRGIPHTDSAHVAGVVYLDVNSCRDAGTSFFQKKPGRDFYQRPEEFLEAAKKYHSGIKLDNYEEMLQTHLDSFEETMRVQPKFNRLILYSSDVWHCQTTYGVSDTRHTFRFFLNITTQEVNLLPLQRFNE